MPFGTGESFHLLVAPLKACPDLPCYSPLAGAFKVTFLSVIIALMSPSWYDTFNYVEASFIS